MTFEEIKALDQARDYEYIRPEQPLCRKGKRQLLHRYGRKNLHRLYNRHRRQPRWDSATPDWVKRRFPDQAATLQHISNLYYTTPDVQLADTLCSRTG